MRLGAPGRLCGPFLLATGFVAPAAAEAGPGMVVGAVEDNVRASSLVEAETRMELLRVSGFRAVRITSYWNPAGARRPSTASASSRTRRRRRNGVRLYVTVMSPGSRTTPLTEEARADAAPRTPPRSPEQRRASAT